EVFAVKHLAAGGVPADPAVVFDGDGTDGVSGGVGDQEHRFPVTHDKVVLLRGVVVVGVAGAPTRTGVARWGPCGVWWSGGRDRGDGGVADAGDRLDRVGDGDRGGVGE